MQELENERQKLLYLELPNLINRILHIVMTPDIYSADCLKQNIEAIKKITNAECENALSYLEKLR